MRYVSLAILNQEKDDMAPITNNKNPQLFVISCILTVYII